MKSLFTTTLFILMMHGMLLAQNSLPYTTGSKHKTTSANQKTCLTITTHDDDPADEVRISWNTAVTGATFTHNNGAVKHASGEICWTPQHADASETPYLFFVTLNDGVDAVVDTFSIRVYGAPARDSMEIIQGNCGEMLLQPHYNKWVDTLFYQIYTLNNVFIASFNSDDHFNHRDTRLQPGTYVLRSSLRNNSTVVYNLYLDTFTITRGYDIAASYQALSEPNEFKISLTNNWNSPNLTYSWKIENSLGEQALSHTAPELIIQVWERTKVCVFVSTPEQCNDTFCATLVVDPNSLAKMEAKAQIYPNPCNTSFFINTNHPLKALFLYDLHGKLVRQWDLANETSLQVELDGLVQGTYMLQSTFQNGSYDYQKLMVH